MGQRWGQAFEYGQDRNQVGSKALGRALAFVGIATEGEQAALLLFASSEAPRVAELCMRAVMKYGKQLRIVAGWVRPGAACRGDSLGRDLSGHQGWPRGDPAAGLHVSARGPRSVLTVASRSGKAAPVTRGL